MDEDVKKLITEVVNDFFAKAPMKMIEKGERIEYYDVCPHCKKEIFEKHTYSEDGGETLRHSDCGGLIEYPETPLEDIVPWLRPYIEKSRNEKMGKQSLAEAKIRIYNKVLSSDLWDEYKHLNPEIRIHLLNLAYDFYKKTKFVAPILDIWLMGSIANYNWTPESDIDVHLIIDFAKLQMPMETAVKASKSAGAQWNEQHNVIIKGHKVEINIQSVNAEKPYVTGIYSLVKDQWIREPQRQIVNVDKMTIKEKYAEVKKYIEDCIHTGNQETMKTAKDFLDDFRQYGLDTHGELSVENIVYKILRNKGIVKALKDSITDIYDQEMSIDETLALSKDYIGTVYGGEVRGTPVADARTAIHKDHGMISGVNDVNWRYLRNRNLVLWNTPPVENDKERVRDYLEKRGVQNPRQIPMYTEVSQSDLKQVHPHNPSFLDQNKQWDFSKMTLDNLNALKAKTKRFIVATQKAGNESPWYQHLPQLVADLEQLDIEINDRLGYINKPITEGDDYSGNFFWLSPDGKLFAMHGRMLHKQWAENFLFQNKITVKPSEVYDKMFSMGWVRLGLYEEGEVLEYETEFEKEPTNLQLRSIKDLAIIKGAKYIANSETKQRISIDEKLMDALPEDNIPYIIVGVLTNNGEIYSGVAITGHDGHANLKLPNGGIGIKVSLWWRYRKIDNTIYFDHMNIDDSDKTKVMGHLKSKYGITPEKISSNPVHYSSKAHKLVEEEPKNLHAENREDEDWINLKNSEQPNSHVSQTSESDLAEGYGAGNPEDDPLHIPGERWRIDWGKRKTPKLTEEDEKLINEVLKNLFGNNK